MRELQLEEEDYYRILGWLLHEMFFGISEMYSELSQTPKMESFAKIVSDFKNSFAVNFY